MEIRGLYQPLITLIKGTPISKMIDRSLKVILGRLGINSYLILGLLKTANEDARQGPML
jgi:hypothetical protein